MLRFLIFAVGAWLGLALTVHSQNISFVGQADPFPSTHKYGDVWSEGDIVCVGAFTKYTANPSYGVGIFSVTNPAAPALLANYNPNPAGNNQFEQGVIRTNIAFFANWSGTNGGLHVVSLANPANPVTLATVGRVTGTVTNGFDRVHTLFLDGDYIYLADHLTAAVKVFNVSNPSLPVFVRNIQTTDPDRVHQITVANGRLFTSGWGGKTDIYDITNVGTQAPPLLGSVNSGIRSHSSWPTPDGNVLVSCREVSGGDVRLFDISNPASPVLLATLVTGGIGIEPAIPHNPVIVGNLLYISWYQAGLQVFDISNPARPVRVGSYDTFPGTISTSFEGNWGVDPSQGIDRVFLSDMQGGLVILNCSDVVTATNNYPPLILLQPASQTVIQGTNVTFETDATGSATLNYQWRLNGVDIPGATGSVLNLNNVQTEDAGSYTVVASNVAGTVTSVVANLTVFIPLYATTIFFDDFETNSISRWSIFPGSGNGIDDYTANFTFNYNSYFSSFHGVNIPSAPNSASGTKGLKLTVNNNDATAATAAVSLYPNGLNLSGTFRLTFDMWINYPGVANGSGSTGSTEFAKFGLNHSGTRVNWASTTSTPSDGVWFAVNGEGGDSVSLRDYRAYQGGTGQPTLLSVANSGFTAGSARYTHTYYQNLFPSPTFQTAGAPGKNWVTVEVAQEENNVLSWRMNGTLIAQRTNTSAFTNGTVMLGLMDTFTSIASPAADSFVLFDNVRVEVVSPVVPPSITGHPQSVTILPEDDAFFAAAATGSAPLSYQWRFNGEPIEGATNSFYTRQEAKPEDAGLYSVQVSNSAGTAFSDAAELILVDAPEISNVIAYPGRTTALITWETTIPSTSQVEYDMHAPHASEPAESEDGEIAAGHGKFNTSSSLDTNLVLQHQVLLTGLEPETEYGFQVISMDGSSEYLSAGYHFTTLHDPLPAPQITGDPESQTNNVNSTAEFSGAATGEPYLFYCWFKDGQPITNDLRVFGADSSSLTILELMVSDQGAYTLMATNEFGTATSQPAILTVNTDLTQPTVKISSPAANFKTLNPSLILSGSATDDVGVQQVKVSINNGSFAAIAGTTSWSATIPLVPGTNSVTVVSVDLAGNHSVPAVRNFFYSTYSLLTLQTTGQGLVSGVTNNTLLEVGKGYKATALVAPGTGFVFSNWTAVAGQVVGTNPVYHFVMQSNLLLTANFIPNPFLAVAGVYNGLFHRPEPHGVSHESSGFFTMKVRTNFVFSGKVQLDGDTVALSGKFGVDGTVFRSVPRVRQSKAPLSVYLDLNFASGDGTISGEVSEVGSWTAVLLGDHAVYGPTNNAPSEYVARYTMMLPKGVNANAQPAGYGYGLLSINTNGFVKLDASHLGDGQVIRQNVSMSRNGEWPLYVPLYKIQRIYTNLAKTTNLATPVLATNKSYYTGSLLGWVTFTTNNAGIKRPVGLLSWIKTGWTNAHYSIGFTNDLDVVGSRYVAPAFGERLLSLTNGTITLADGNLDATLTRSVFLKTNNVSVITPTNQLVKLTFGTKTGQLKGDFRHPDNNNVVTRFFGAVLQEQNYGAGMFVGTNQTGSILLEADEE